MTMNNKTKWRRSFSSRGFSLSYLDTNPEDSNRAVVLFLHGFPDTAELWLKQMEGLSRDGYRCIAPDTLGCGQSDIAPGLGDYHVLKICGDHIALLNHLGVERAHVVGHDWGAAAAWQLASYYPERLISLTALSVGHINAFSRAGWSQKKASWYMVYFCLPWLSERLLMGEGKFSLPKVFAPLPDSGKIMARLRKPGRMVAALRIYRASLISTVLRKHPRVSVPTLMVWSRGDRFLKEEQAVTSKKWVDGPWHFDCLECHHWISVAEPEWLNKRLRQHLAQFGDL